MHLGRPRQLRLLPRLLAVPRDAVIAVCWLGVGVLLWGVGATGLWWQLALITVDRWVFLVTLVAACSLLLLRSRRPFLALSLGVVVTAVDTLCGASLGVVFVFTDLIYAAVKYSSRRGVRVLMRCAVVVGVALTAAVVLTFGSNPGLAIMLVQWGLIVAVSGLWGWNVRAERAKTAAELAAQHATETRALRRHIAHDLHDLVANHIAVAGLNIEAAKLQQEKQEQRAEQDARPGAPQLTEALGRAKAGTDRAQSELRGLIRVLNFVDEDVTEDCGGAEDLAGLGLLLPAGRTLRWEGAAADILRAEIAAAASPRDRVIVRALGELVANAAKYGTGDLRVAANVTRSAAAPHATQHPDPHDERAVPPVLHVRLENDVPAAEPMSAVHAPAASGELAGGGSCSGTDRRFTRPDSSGPGFGIVGTRALLSSVGGTLRTEGGSDGWVAIFTVPTVQREVEERGKDVWPI